MSQVEWRPFLSRLRRNDTEIRNLMLNHTQVSEVTVLRYLLGYARTKQLQD